MRASKPTPFYLRSRRAAELNQATHYGLGRHWFAWLSGIYSFIAIYFQIIVVVEDWSGKGPAAVLMKVRVNSYHYRMWGLTLETFEHPIFDCIVMVHWLITGTWPVYQYVPQAVLDSSIWRHVWRCEHLFPTIFREWYGRKIIELLTAYEDSLGYWRYQYLERNESRGWWDKIRLHKDRYVYRIVPDIMAAQKGKWGNSAALLFPGFAQEATAIFPVLQPF